MQNITEENLSVLIENYKRELNQLESQMQQAEWELQNIKKEIDTREKQLLEYFSDFPVDGNSEMKKNYIQQKIDFFYEKLKKLKAEGS